MPAAFQPFNPTQFIDAIRAAASGDDHDARQATVNDAIAAMKVWVEGGEPSTPLASQSRPATVKALWSLIRTLREQERPADALEVWARFREKSCETDPEIAALALSALTSYQDDSNLRSVTALTRIYLVVLEALQLPASQTLSKIRARLDEFFNLICVDRTGQLSKAVEKRDRILLCIEPLAHVLPPQLRRRVEEHARLAKTP